MTMKELARLSPTSPGGGCTSPMGAPGPAGQPLTALGPRVVPGVFSHPRHSATPRRRGRWESFSHQSNCQRQETQTEYPLKEPLLSLFLQNHTERWACGGRGTLSPLVLCHFDTVILHYGDVTSHKHQAFLRLYSHGRNCYWRRMTGDF